MLFNKFTTWIIKNYSIALSGSLSRDLSDKLYKMIFEIHCTDIALKFVTRQTHCKYDNIYKI